MLATLKKAGNAGTRTRSSATRASARWMPTSSRRPRWTARTARCAACGIGDAENAGRVFELLMGNEVAPRKEFIIDSSDALERDRIDA